jgi:hypothetical protein
MIFVQPWEPVDAGATRDGLAQELLREVAPGHPLYGIPVRAIARRNDCDDVLFALQDGSGRVAVVHLTWIRSIPDRPPWPGTSLYPSLGDWSERGMRVDEEDG